MIQWFFDALKQYPEIAIFLALALGYYFGKFTFKGIGLGSVTATLIAGVVIGQIGITINQPLKAFSFLMFLFAVGYGVGPQFVRGIASTGLPQAAFSAVQCVFSLVACVVIAKIAGYDLGYAAGFYSGSQTISAAMGLSTDAITKVPHDDSAKWTRNEPNSKCRERSKSAGERRNLRKELRREYNRGSRTVDEKVVPLDRGADRARKRDAACF